MSTKGKGIKKRVPKKEKINQSPSPSREFVSKVLRGEPREKGFYFYSSEGNPTGSVACSLAEFCDSLNSLSVVTIQFHLGSGDFESWISFLGDDTLVRQLGLLRSKNLSGEALQHSFVSIVQERQHELQKLV